MKYCAFLDNNASIRCRLFSAGGVSDRPQNAITEAQSHKLTGVDDVVWMGKIHTTETIPSIMEIKKRC